MADNDVILDVRSISKHFGALKAVDKVSFQARKGEILGLIGPNGAGKTTITNLVTGDLRKTEGEVYFKGINISNMQPFQIARIGLTRTYQVVKPLQGMTVEENVLVGSLFGRSSRDNDLNHARKNAREIMKLVGLDKKKEFKVSDITLPDLKRMEFARVLAMDPEVVFLDEVMAGLNPSEVEESMEMVKKIREDKQLTIIYIEHIMKAVMGISDRIIVLHHGEKICAGSPQEVCDNPAVIEAYLGKKYAKEVMDN
ncbi:MAG: ABC transporter ATP-binding protein [Atribacterota bacterium]|nr:ABC transporter ATP-binding protein [Atribacterota bacterium]MDD5637622.1 ABC transporter ATP-binding protein [Atribacterota bacterium]